MLCTRSWRVWLVALVAALASATAFAQHPFATISTGIPGTNTAVLHSGLGKLYVGNPWGPSVVGVNTTDLYKSWTGSVDGTPLQLILDEAGNRLYVLMSGGIAVFDTKTDVGLPPSILLPGAANEGAVFNPVTKRLYVPSTAPGPSFHVAVVDIDSKQVVATLPTTSYQRGLCINEVTSRVYVVNSSSNGVSVFDGATNAEVAGSPIVVGNNPSSCVVDPVHNRIITTNKDSASISVIDGGTNAVAVTLPTGIDPYLAIVNTGLNVLAVANGASRTVSLFRLDTLDLITEIDVQWSPVRLAIDESALALYVGTFNQVTWAIELRTYTKQGTLWGQASSPTGGGSVALIPHQGRCYIAYGNVDVYKCRDFRRAWDINDDGLSDIAWYNTSTRENALWLMNGTAPLASEVTLGSSDWVPVLRGDLDGDGHSDFVFRNTSTHETAAWFMEGTAPRAGGAAIILGPSSYEPIFSVRCAGDDARCVVWRDPVSGNVAYWYMPGGPTPAYSQVIYSGDPDWRPVLTGDFDGDAHTDLVWRHTDGRVAIWLMKGDAKIGFAYSFYYIVLGPGTGWLPTIVADFDADGRSDILWRNETTGDTVVWLMDGLGRKGTWTIMYGASGWTATHAPQLMSGFAASLIWRHTSGTTALWADFRGYQGDFLLSTDPDWKVTHTLHANMDESEDLLWRNSVTGQTVIWTMDDWRVTGSAVLSSDPNWRVVPGN